MLRHFSDMIMQMGIDAVRIKMAEPPFDDISLTAAMGADCSGFPEQEHEGSRYERARRRSS